MTTRGDDLRAAGTMLALAATEYDKLTTDLASTQAALAQAKASGTAQAATIATLTAQVADLTAKLAAATAPVPTPTPTPTPTPPPAPGITAARDTTVPSSITATWVGFSPAYFGIDGPDDGGPWSTDLRSPKGLNNVELAAKKFVFTGRATPGQLYTLTAKDSAGKAYTTTVTTAPAPTPAPVPVPPAPAPTPAGSRHLRQGFFKWNAVQQAIDFGNSVGVEVDVWHVSVLSNDTSLQAFTDFGGATWLKAKPTRIMVTNWNWLTQFPGGWDNNQTDSEARAFATTMHNLGIENQVVVRPGYEPNASWMPWSSLNDPAGYQRLWRRIIPIMRSIAPGLRFDWSLQPGAAGTATDPLNCYPGDDLVDFCTMDQYDWWLSGSPQQRWDGFINGPTRGLPWLRDFAKTHGKKWGIDETGLVSSSNGTQGGGDNPFFITSLYDWCESNGAFWVMYEDTDDDIGTYLESNPNGFNAYKAWFQARPTLIGA